MSQRIMVIAAVIIALAGCERQRNAALSQAQVGRFQYYPPAGEMPAVLLDTATGCVETFEKITSLDNPKDVRWWRSYADTGKPLVTYENGQAKAVPNSAPPQRCSLEGKNK